MFLLIGNGCITIHCKGTRVHNKCNLNRLCHFVQHDFHVWWCSLCITVTRRLSPVEQELLRHPGESALCKGLQIVLCSFVRFLSSSSSYGYVIIHFYDSRLLLTRILLIKRFLVANWKSSLRMLFVRHHDLINTSVIYLSHMNTDMFPLSLSQFHHFLIHDLPLDFFTTVIWRMQLVGRDNFTVQNTWIHPVFLLASFCSIFIFCVYLCRSLSVFLFSLLAIVLSVLGRFMFQIATLVFSNFTWIWT